MPKGKNVRVRITCVGDPKVLRTIHRDASLGASLRGLMSTEDLSRMFPAGSNVEFSFHHGEIHLRAEGSVNATFGTKKMIPGETHVLRRDDVQTLGIADHRVLKLHVISSHF